MKSEKLSFLEIVGALTIVVGFFPFMYYVGWYIFFVILWVGSLGMCIYMMNAFIEKYEIQYLFFGLFISVFSAVFFFMTFGQFIDAVNTNFNQILIWYPIILGIVSIVLVLLFRRADGGNGLND